MVGWTVSSEAEVEGSVKVRRLLDSTCCQSPMLFTRRHARIWQVCRRDMDEKLVMVDYINGRLTRGESPLKVSLKPHAKRVRGNLLSLVKSFAGIVLDSVLRAWLNGQDVSQAMARL